MRSKPQPEITAEAEPEAPAAPRKPYRRQSTATQESDLTALPGTQIEEEPTKGRRRSRSGTAHAGVGGQANRPRKRRPKMSRRRCRWNTAEQRTTDKDDLFKHMPDGGIDDDLFFFPRSEPAAPPSPPPAAREPEPEPEPEPPAPHRAGGMDPAASAVALTVAQGGRPAGRSRPSSRGSIEDDLAADLDALDASKRPCQLGAGERRSRIRIA